ncbi:MAG TPA: nitrate ABC transporter ATP-binding protein [Chloroflexi bacterium]|nr:nitrate ABC transporter ATP-binding protein [Chloroflexota bacterium]
MPPTPLVEGRHVEVSYGSGPHRFVALADIHLQIQPREFVALLGPSGSGKSTLLRLLAGLQRPTSGAILYRGQPLRGVNPHATIVFQSFALFPWLTVQGNVELALEARGVPSQERARRAVALLDLVGLDGFEGAYPRELSGGMRQKVGFARALAVEPELLCLDEPFSALDILSAESLRRELLELWTEQKLPTKAILMVSHNIEEAISLADRVIVMAKEPGRIVSTLPIPLPHPRNPKAPAFVALVDMVYGLITGRARLEAEVLGTAPGQPGPTTRLPDADIEAISGLLEEVLAAGGPVDLYRLADDLSLELDDLLPIIAAAELLAFLRVAEGDARLTELGETFAEARILARKEIFAARIQRVPLIHWLMDQLDAAPGGRLAEEPVLAVLTQEFGPEEAPHQLDTAIDWGRYAELFAYDRERGELSLEAEPLVVAPRA